MTAAGKPKPGPGQANTNQRRQLNLRGRDSWVMLATSLNTT